MCPAVAAAIALLERFSAICPINGAVAAGNTTSGSDRAIGARTRWPLDSHATTALAIDTVASTQPSDRADVASVDSTSSSPRPVPTNAIATPKAIQPREEKRTAHLGDGAPAHRRAASNAIAGTSGRT